MCSQYLNRIKKREKERKEKKKEKKEKRWKKEESYKGGDKEAEKGRQRKNTIFNLKILKVYSIML